MGKQIDSLLDRIMEASSPSVIGAYEKRIAELERQKIRLTERAESAVPEAGRLTESIEPALTLLANHWNTHTNGSFALKRTVLKLAFAEPLRYSRNEDYRPAETTFPFKVLADFQSLKCGMVEGAGFEPA
jgi:site-specific DNA recombinase